MRRPEAEVIDFFCEHLASYETPRSVSFLDEIPRTGSGRILERVLREPYRAERLTRVQIAALGLPAWFPPVSGQQAITITRRGVPVAELRAVTADPEAWLGSVAYLDPDLTRPVEQWVDIALALPGIQLAALEPAIAVRSTKLPGEFHPDPVDRIIVSTALENAVSIITPDERIRCYPHVQSAW